ncbi:MAG: acyloxyacyl hydrolase [Pseudomonadota bacterium]
MRRMMTLALSAIGLPGLAAADLVDEVRVGVIQHNICVSDCKNADKEDGPNIHGEVVFNSPEFLSILFSPKPYVIASVNAAGNTSFGGVGLNWDIGIADGWSIEPGLGYVIHDGELENPFVNGTPESIAFGEENVLLGSEDLFRTSLSLTRDLNTQWRAQLTYEHLSHGQILGDGRNQGMDSIGVRLGYRFGG